jgi:hypothetical protein
LGSSLKAEKFNADVREIAPPVHILLH